MVAVISVCESLSPCANNGNCTSKGAFDFICQCAVGYTGHTCEINIDECLSANCPSNSMCVDGVNTFECMCLSGFEEVNSSCVLRTESPNTGIILVAFRQNYLVQYTIIQYIGETVLMQGFIRNFLSVITRVDVNL